MIVQKSIIDSNGRVPLPSKLRSLLGVKVGEEVIMKYHNGEIIITSYKHSLDSARRLIRKYTNRSLLQDLEEIQNQDHND